MIELAILGLLQDQPLHGYELKKRLGETLGTLWGVSYGSLYPALRRLEKSGAIEATEPDGSKGAPVPATGSLTGDLAAARRRRLPNAGRRTRKAYRVTDSGRVAFRELLTAPAEGGDDERTFALKLAFCGHLDVAERVALLERRRSVLAERLARATRSRGPASLDRYTRSLVEHRTRSTERDLEWVDDLIATERSTQSPQEGATAS